jgi:hypothetical protein
VMIMNHCSQACEIFYVDHKITYSLNMKHFYRLTIANTVSVLNYGILSGKN